MSIFGTIAWMSSEKSFAVHSVNIQGVYFFLKTEQNVCLYIYLLFSSVLQLLGLSSERHLFYRGALFANGRSSFEHDAKTNVTGFPYRQPNQQTSKKMTTNKIDCSKR